MAKSTSKLFQSEEPKTMKEDAMNLPEAVEETVVEEKIPEEKTEVVDTPPVSEDDVQDIDLSATKKKKFRINGDKNKILELNTSDMNITSRLSTSYKRLTSYMNEVANTLQSVPDDESEITAEQEELVQKELADIDAKMRKEMDYIFDAPVSDTCCDGGSMYDPFDGMFRFEHIIEALANLYTNNLSSEFAKMRKRIDVKTSKYTKKYHN